ncbi:MAG: DUF5110 domain-containing protein [Candidatus Omnitrophica bacterium]|nr:DUF5110 domain-containing protein [Candidatus Omnitrophota bacterium]MBU1631255.1 DUF5110 domain-containing protein [Candidatus Omnitrophota bacterium]MBU1767074.1 DUF5110 domain-containing protein [Candidatus Omnitrophota bacterium]MBU1889404.1 DUF5110 domain-containing protein [Candidatus Omnitrophota bacterium]
MGEARFTVIAPECIRMEYSKTAKFIDARSTFAINRKAAFKDFKILQQGNKTIIDTGKLELIYSPDGNPFNPQNLKAYIKKGKETIEWVPGKQNQQNLGGTIRTLDGVRGPVDLGDGLLARDGWYLLDDSQSCLFTDDWIEARPQDSGTDWYLFGYGDDYKAALKVFTRIAGEVPMPRKYVLGAWYSRYWPYSSEDYRQIVEEYRQQDFPLDVMVLDMDWHRAGWTGWSVNRELLPDFEDLLKWFHEHKLFVTLNVHPADGVGPHEDTYEEFMEALGKDPSTNEWLPFDAGDKKYLESLFEHTHVPLEKKGVDFWWLDWQQYPFTRSIPSLSNLAWLNHFYYQHTGKNNQRGQSFSRWAGWGDHRYPIHFSGDADTSWSMLAFEVPFTSTAGNVGCFFWSHDIGGHWGSRNEESYTRWVQFGSTTAALRSHSTRSPELDRRPWKYSEQAEDSMRIAFHLRSLLFPYIYSSVWQSHRESLPLNRPMYLEYPEEEKAYCNPHQYFFGDTFLVAPIVSLGAGPNKVATQTVWFPEGMWYNWFTGERYSGNKEVIVAADINEFPFYAKGGMPIPNQSYTSRMTTEPLKELVIRCYPGEDGKTGNYSLYEDDGFTKDYLKDNYALTTLSYMRKGNIVTVKVSPVKGSYNGQVKSRSYIIELPCTRKAETVKINGKSTRIIYDEKTYTNRIKVPIRSVSQPVTVKVKVEEANFDDFRHRAASRRLQGLLGKTTNQSSQDIIVQYAQQNNPNDAVLETLLAIAGIGVKKSKTEYLYKGPERTCLYNGSDLIDGNTFGVTITDYIGEGKKVIFSQDYKVRKPSSFCIPEIPFFPKPPWVGAHNSQIMQIDFKIKGYPISLYKTTAGKGGHLSKWNIVGPFEFDKNKKLSEQKYGPEEGQIDLSVSYKGADYRDIQWQKAEINEDNIVNLIKYFKFDDKIVYAVTYLHSEREQEVVLKINSDDGVEVWLNGEKIHSMDVGRSIAHEPDVVKPTLKSGNNILLLKVSQHGYEWGFKVEIESFYPTKEAYSEFH